MNMRSPRVDLEKLTSLTDQIIENLKKAEDNEYYLVIGNPGLRNKSKNNKIAYLIGKETDIPKTFLMLPEMHKTKEGIPFCECPDFYYSARAKEEQLNQAMSLELAVKMAKKIHGLIVIINHNDLYIARGNAYKDLIQTLGKLFNSNFEEIFKSSIFVITNKPEGLNKKDFLDSINANLKMLQEELPFEEDEEFQEKNECLIKAKMELAFSQLVISHADQVLMLDESDNGESRKILLKSLSKITSIESSKFNFDSLYSNLLKGFDFNLRKFIDDILSKTISHALRIVV